MTIVILLLQRKLLFVSSVSKTISLINIKIFEYTTFLAIQGQLIILQKKIEVFINKGPFIRYVTLYIFFRIFLNFVLFQ